MDSSVIIGVLASLSVGLIIAIATFLLTKSSENKKFDEHKKTESEAMHEVVSVLKALSGSVGKVEKDVVEIVTTLRSYDKLWEIVDTLKAEVADLRTEVGIIKSSCKRHVTTRPRKSVAKK